MSPGNRCVAAVPDDRRQGGGHPLERLHRFLGAVLLDEAEGGIENHDHDDSDGVRHLAKHARNHGGGEQHDDHEVLELVEEHREQRAPALGDQLVRAVRHETLCGLGGAQAGGSGAESRECRVDVQDMPPHSGCGVLSLRTSIVLTSFRRWRPPLRATPPPSWCSTE